jgi:ABC-type transport system involved in cytochrome bd biosynthesis fused ATPase/permease subunit
MPSDVSQGHRVYGVALLFGLVILMTLTVVLVHFMEKAENLENNAKRERHQYEIIVDNAFDQLTKLKCLISNKETNQVLALAELDAQIQSLSNAIEQNKGLDEHESCLEE